VFTGAPATAGEAWTRPPATDGGHPAKLSPAGCALAWPPPRPDPALAGPRRGSPFASAARWHAARWFRQGGRQRTPGCFSPRRTARADRPNRERRPACAIKRHGITGRTGRRASNPSLRRAPENPLVPRPSRVYPGNRNRPLLTNPHRRRGSRGIVLGGATGPPQTCPFLPAARDRRPTWSPWASRGSRRPSPAAQHRQGPPRAPNAGLGRPSVRARSNGPDRPWPPAMPWPLSNVGPGSGRRVKARPDYFLNGPLSHMPGTPELGIACKAAVPRAGPTLRRAREEDPPHLPLRGPGAEVAPPPGSCDAGQCPGWRGVHDAASNDRPPRSRAQQGSTMVAGLPPPRRGEPPAVSFRAAAVPSSYGQPASVRARDPPPGAGGNGVAQAELSLSPGVRLKPDPGPAAAASVAGRPPSAFCSRVAVTRRPLARMSNGRPIETRPLERQRAISPDRIRPRPKASRQRAATPRPRNPATAALPAAGESPPVRPQSVFMHSVFTSGPFLNSSILRLRTRQWAAAGPEPVCSRCLIFGSR